MENNAIYLILECVYFITVQAINAHIYSYPIPEKIGWRNNVECIKSRAIVSASILLRTHLSAFENIHLPLPIATVLQKPGNI